MSKEKVKQYVFFNDPDECDQFLRCGCIDWNNRY